MSTGSPKCNGVCSSNAPMSFALVRGCCAPASKLAIEDVNWPMTDSE
jgi:hypothetical protein